jgi:hypothetical protein
MARIGRIPFWEWLPGRTWRIVATVDAADEIPDRLPSHGAVMVGSRQSPKWLAFDCPCKSGHRVMVTLDPAHRPHWVLTNAKKLSISPSVDYRTNERRCHYLLTDGKIIWVKELERRHHGRSR